MLFRSIAFLISILLCPYLAYFCIVIFPEWKRSFGHWKILDHGIGQGKILINWEEIENVAVFSIPSSYKSHFFKQPERKVALVNGAKKQICLEGNLINFDGIVEHIRKKSGCKENNYNSAKFFLRKKYSMPKLARYISIFSMFILTVFSFWFIRNYEHEVVSKGKLGKAQIADRKSVV